MAVDIKKLQEIAKPADKEAVSRAEFRKKNRKWLKLSQKIALELHYYLRRNGMSNREFADRLGVSPVYVTKLLKGNENLTLETICKLQDIIGTNLIEVKSSYSVKVCMSVRPVVHVWMSPKTVESDKYVSSVKGIQNYQQIPVVFA